jgi:hypothetical protein
MEVSILLTLNASHRDSYIEFPSAFPKRNASWLEEEPKRPHNSYYMKNLKHPSIQNKNKINISHTHFLLQTYP